MQSLSGQLLERRLFVFRAGAAVLAAAVFMLSWAGDAAAVTRYVSTGAELNSAIGGAVTGDVIELTRDIDAVSSSTYSTGQTFIIDGKGYTIDGRGSSNTGLRFSGSNVSVTLKNATLRNMRTTLSYGGGAVAMYRGYLTIENCAFIGNQNNPSSSQDSNRGGGAVFVQTGGSSGTHALRVTNSTFYGNSAPRSSGGAIMTRGYASVTNCTVVGNSASAGAGGVGCSTASRTGITNSIVVGNSAGGSPSDVHTLIDNGYNLVGVMTNTTKAGTTTINQTTATIGMEDEPDDNFGSGGSPYTIALLPGSDAIDAGGSTYPATDQRGIARDDGQGDIGAHEFVLADAVRAPKATPPAGAYDVAPNVALSTATLGADIYYTLNGDDPTVGGATQYIAPIPITGTTLIKAAAWNGAQWSRILEAGYTLFTAMPEANPSAGSYWEAKEIELSAADGAVIYYTLDGSEPDRSATLYTSPILLNTTGTHTLKAIAYLGDSRESAVMTAAYDVTVPDVIEVSTGIELDAAINSASLSAPKKIILMNDVDAVASSTYSNSPRVVIDGNGYAINGRNQNRTSLRFGGSGTTAHVTVRNATLRNMATNLSYGGGALGVYIGSLTVENCAFIGNSAYGASGNSNGGGAVCAHNSQTSLKVSNSTFYGNETGGSGGAILSTGTADVVNCTITGNMSVSRGAGVSASSATNSRLYNSIVVGNRVSDGYTGTDVVDSYNFTDMGYNIRGTVNTFRHPTSASGKSADEAGIKAGPPEASDSLGGSPYIIALLPGSPAIDAADPDVDVNDVDITRDQRGVARDENPDIGAYEYEDETPPASGGGNGGGGGSGGGGNGSGGGPSDPGSGNGGDDEEPPISAGIVDPPISATTDPDVEIGGNAHNVTDGELGGILDALPGDKAEALGGATSSGASGGIVSNPGEVAGGLSELDKAELDAGADAMIPLPVFKAEVNDGRTVLVSMAVSLSKFAGNNLSEVAVLKYRCDGVTERLEPAASPEGISHARYAWTDANGAALSGALKISAGRLYYLSVAIKDDSVHDWDPTPGSVVDPMALALVKSAANGGNDEASSGGSGGCDAGFGLLGLAALAGLSVFARRARAR